MQAFGILYNFSVCLNVNIGIHQLTLSLGYENSHSLVLDIDKVLKHGAFTKQLEEWLQKIRSCNICWLLNILYA